MQNSGTGRREEKRHEKERESGEKKEKMGKSRLIRSAVRRAVEPRRRREARLIQSAVYTRSCRAEAESYLCEVIHTGHDGVRVQTFTEVIHTEARRQPCSSPPGPCGCNQQSRDFILARRTHSYRDAVPKPRSNSCMTALALFRTG